MITKQHLEIFFKGLIIDNNINFFELWEHTNEKTNTKKFDTNKPQVYTRMLKNLYLCKYFVFTNKIDGDFVECGVLRGFSSYLLRILEEKINKQNIKRNYYLIDSFEGLSEILDEDKVLNAREHQHQKGDLKANYESVKQTFSKFDNVKILKGWIPDVFSNLDKNINISFLHIDVDLYQPSIDCLNFLYDKVVKGGVILTDDYRSSLFPGNRKAWEQFFSKKGINTWVSLPSNQAIFIKV